MKETCTVIGKIETGLAGKVRERAWYHKDVIYISPASVDVKNAKPNSTYISLQWIQQQALGMVYSRRQFLYSSTLRIPIIRVWANL